MEHQGELVVGIVPQLAYKMLLGWDLMLLYGILDRVCDAEIEYRKIRNHKGWLGEVEESEGSADESDDIDLSDIASSLQFQEVQEEDQELWMLRVQAHDTRDNVTLPTIEIPWFETDALETAIGAVLTQKESGTERSVAYISCKMLPAETIERECLVIQWVVDHFRDH
ncbi:hypothetical protein Y1Q_0013621 [Alligator mississippiensis]|uniref:Reverse transcriptase/retrotransposon-derived protein RNase H-like domain-containing protein n=1 Tax=Alligator mississippiensis TaxID=8496 RepID=A0A151P3I0_ALLMI|nr:hypothetical protein Y1Q_0013621 [Alligator mississippiensis]